MVEIVLNGAGVAFVAFCVLMAVRREIVRSHCMKRVAEVHEHNKRFIRAGEYHRCASYYSNQTAMMFDFRKWTYKQFFLEAGK